MKTTRDDMIQEIEELKAELSTLTTALDAAQAAIVICRQEIARLDSENGLALTITQTEQAAIMARLAKEYPGGA
jgi:hypothetical protein